MSFLKSCKHSPLPSFLKFTIPFALAASVATASDCESPGTSARLSTSGMSTVTSKSGRQHSLHWIKLNHKTTVGLGTVFYLAGGPVSHMAYTDMAAEIQEKAFPGFDVILYDYYGFNCSGPIQDPSLLSGRQDEFTMSALAWDFIQLKRTLIGENQQIVLMGGSFGSMLGAQIIRDYPAEIAKAVLFSGDPTTGWLKRGWFKFDSFLRDLASKDKLFRTDLDTLFDLARRKYLSVRLGSRDIVLDKGTLEVAMWLSTNMDSLAQEKLVENVRLESKGRKEWLQSIVSVYENVLVPVTRAPAPTDSSVVTNFFRCNIWLPLSTRRLKPSESSPWQFLDPNSLFNYWNTLCVNYDLLGEFHYDARPVKPTRVPVLFWMGDRDTFDTEASRKHWEKITSELTFKVMKGWSHDFGVNPDVGFTTITKMIEQFL